MRDISDEMLMAYADDELDGEGRALVDAYLNEEPKTAERLAVFVSTGRRLGKVFDRPMNEPVPQHLIDTVLKISASNAAAANPSGVARVGRGAQVIDFSNVRRSRTQRLPDWALAAACAGVVAVGTGLFWILHVRTQGSAESYAVTLLANGSKVAHRELASALDTITSGSSVEKTIDGTVASIRPVFSFASAGGGYCRQYEINPADAVALAGVACRTSGGNWQIEGQARTDAATTAAAEPNTTIKPAGNANVPAVDAIVDRMISGDVLGIDDEARVIKNEWRAPDASSNEPTR